MTLTQDIQGLDQSSDVYIYELTNYDDTNPYAKFRFSNQQVSWGGSVSLIPVQHEAVEVSSSGPQPRLNITVGDPGGMISTLIDEVGGLEGANLRVVRTKYKFTDAGATPDLSAILQEATYTIARKSNHVPFESVSYEAVNPIESASTGSNDLPSRVCLRQCVWSYRGEECGYSNPQGFTLDNQPTNDPNLDRCAKSLEACKLRHFGVLPTSAFPSLSRR